MENVSSRCGKSDNAPRLRFPEFSGEWVEKKLGEIFFEVNERKHPELPVLSIQQGIGTVFRDISERRIAYDKANINAYKVIEPGDFIIHLRSFEGGLECSKHKGISSPAYKILRSNCIDSAAFKDYFRSYNFIEGKLAAAVTGIRDGKNIDMPTFWSLKINIPSLPEQKKIAAFFTLLDRRIQKQRQLVECLKTYKRGVIDKFFCNNSYDFELYRLEEIGKFIRGLSYKEDEQTYDNQKTLVLRSNNIRDNGFLNYKEGLQFVTKIPDCEQLLQKNDLVFCMANGSSKLVGKNAVYDGRYNGKITVGTFCCIYRSKFHILQYYFQSSLFQKTLGKIQQGGGGSIGNLKPSDLEPLIVKLPNKYTQEKIFNCLSFFDSYIKLHENKLSSLLSLKSSLLQKMFI